MSKKVHDPTDRTSPRDRPEQIPEALGRILFETLDKLAPGEPGSVVSWDKLTNWERDLYLNAVDRLLEERELLKAWVQRADDDLISRGG